MEIKKFLGLRNTTASERLKPGHLEYALDLDIDGDGSLVTRRGQTLVTAAASHSMFAAGRLCLVVQSKVLKRMSEAGALTTLATLASDNRVAYVEHAGVVYYTNAVDTGRVVGNIAREWGVRNPAVQPVAASGFGLLSPARYLYAMTFLRSDGAESGSREPALIELTDIGGISFSSIEQSTDAMAAGAVLYLSGPNGTELYRAAVVPHGTTSYSYGNAGLDLGSPLHPDPVSPPPAGQALAVHAGVMYVAEGDVIWASDQYNLERFRMSRRFLRLPGYVTMVKSVDDGLYAATADATWFFAGTDPEEMRARQVLDVGAVPNTCVTLDSAERAEPDEKDAQSRPAAMWMSSDGVIYGDAAGNVTKVTMDDYGIPAGTAGAAVLRARDGSVHYVVTTRGNASAGNAHP